MTGVIFSDLANLLKEIGLVGTLDIEICPDIGYVLTFITIKKVAFAITKTNKGLITP